MKKKKTSPSAYVLEPGQSVADYKRLERLWYKKASNFHASPTSPSKVPGTAPSQPKNPSKRTKPGRQGFKDIEFLDDRGFPSPYFRDYPAARLVAEFTPEKEEYWRRARIFLQDYNWLKSDLKGLSSPMCRFIWAHYSEGLSLREIVKTLEGSIKPLVPGPVPSKRYVNRPAQGPPTLFWVHEKLTNVLLPVFEAWCKSPEGAAALAVEWDLSP